MRVGSGHCVTAPPTGQWAGPEEGTAPTATKRSAPPGCAAPSARMRRTELGRCARPRLLGGAEGCVPHCACAAATRGVPHAGGGGACPEDARPCAHAHCAADAALRAYVRGAQSAGAEYACAGGERAWGALIYGCRRDGCSQPVRRTASQYGTITSMGASSQYGASVLQ